MIQIQITRKEKNPEYKAPENIGGVFYQKYNIPEYSTFEVLDVEITEKQFEAIRKEVLKIF